MPAANDPSPPNDPSLRSLLISASDHLGAAGASAPPGAADLAFGPPAAPGEVGTLGPYRVVRALGQGAMGAVFLAQDTRLDRPVALKVMLPELAADADAKERFLREAKAAARISHDNVVTVHEADERDGVPYIAMQLLQGLSLDAFLQTKGTPSLRNAVRIAREAALGLAAAHKLGTVHRDIKPANLWLEAPRGRVKVLDFGLARPGGLDTELTRSGAVLGTPAFMSPEQALGERVDHRTDMYSLGAVLYLLCTRQLPLPGASVGAVLRALGTEEPKPVRAHNPNVPEPLAELIQQLLAKDPEARPPSAAEVADRLQGVLEQPASLVGGGPAEPPTLPPEPAGSRAPGADPWTTRNTSTASHRGGHPLARPGDPKLLRTMPVVVITPAARPETTRETEEAHAGRPEEPPKKAAPLHTVISSNLVWKDPPEEAEEADPPAGEAGRDRPRRKRAKAAGKKNGATPILIGVGVAAVGVAVAVVALVAAGRKPQQISSAPTEVLNGSAPYTRGTDAPPNSFAEKPQRAAGPHADPGPAGQAAAIDLLAVTDPKADAVLGQWTRSGGALVGVNPTFPAVLQLPYEPGEEYDVEATVRRLSGDEYFGFQLVAGGRRVSAAIDTWPSRGYLSGLGNIGGKTLLDNGTGVRGRRLVGAAADHLIGCSVRRGQIVVSVNGVAVTSYSGDFSRLSIHSDFSVPNDKALAVQIGYATHFRIDRLVVTPVSGAAEPSGRPREYRRVWRVEMTNPRVLRRGFVGFW